MGRPGAAVRVSRGAEVLLVHGVAFQAEGRKEVGQCRTEGCAQAACGRRCSNRNTRLRRWRTCGVVLGRAADYVSRAWRRERTGGRHRQSLVDRVLLRTTETTWAGTGQSSHRSRSGTRTDQRGHGNRGIPGGCGLSKLPIHGLQIVIRVCGLSRGGQSRHSSTRRAAVGLVITFPISPFPSRIVRVEPTAEAAPLSACSGTRAGRLLYGSRRGRRRSAGVCNSSHRPAALSSNRRPRLG